MYDAAIVDEALRLSGNGFSDRAVAQACGVSVGAVRKWRGGTRRAGRDPARSDWRDGRVKRDCPRCFERELDRRSYAYLLGVYLGDGHIVATTKGCFRLSLSCCAGWPGLVEAAAGSMAAVLPRSKVHRRRVSGAVEVNSQSKHWPCLFPQHGPGKKHTRRIELAPWQLEIADGFTEELVRGLIHSDGCRSLNRVRRPLSGGERVYTYPRYTFTNKSRDIQGIFTRALDRLEVPWRQMNAMNISVAKRAAVARLDEFVGPKH